MSQKPLFLSISSQRDLVTRKAMPLAQWVTLRGRATRKTYDDDALQRGQLRQRQSYYNNNSEANVECLRTHEIKVVNDHLKCSALPPDQLKAPKSSKDQSADNQPILFFDADNKCHVMVPYKNEKCTKGDDPWNTTPFWVVSAPGSVISNHSEIFQSGIPALLQAIIQRYTIDPASQPMQKAASGATGNQ
jgi:hypothetical protein